MQSNYIRHPDTTLEINITVPWSEIKIVYDKLVDEAVKQVQIQGFRQGKTPDNLAKKKIDKSKILAEVLKQMLPKIYADSLQAHKLNPILSPQVEVIQAKEDQDWQFKAKTCEQPIVDLGNYRQAISKIQPKKSPLWTPEKAKTEKIKSEDIMGEVLNALHSEIKVILSELLIEREIERMLANTFDQLQKLGLTVDQYLQAQGKTSQSLRGEYHQQAKKTLSLEFALEKIADTENITVEPAEVEAVIQKAKTEEEKKALSNQKYYISSLLRRQKTLQKLVKPTIITV